jgi:AcrR family transcriptional regulator
MKKKSSRNTKSKIVSAAWSLFYEQGYDDTTIDEIVEASGTSKGSFYHYFDGKDALLSSLSYLFDKKYEELMETMDPAMKPVDKLVYINQELFLMIDNTVSVELLCRLFSSQLSAKAEKHLLDTGRTYYKLLRKIAMEGMADGTFRDDFTVSDITRAYAMFERGLMCDWCIGAGNYSLCQHAQTMMRLLLKGFCKEDN